MKVAVMALSGGMDSTSLLLRLLREGNTVYTIGFNYGQKHIVELSRAQDNIDYFFRFNFIFIKIIIYRKVVTKFLIM